MIDAFVALVCVAVGVWRRSWALLLRPCEALSHAVLLVALCGRADERDRARRAMSHRRAGRRPCAPELPYDEYGRAYGRVYVWGDMVMSYVY